MNDTILLRKPDSGNRHTRFGDGEDVSEKPRRKALSHMNVVSESVCACFLLILFSTAMAFEKPNLMPICEAWDKIKSGIDDIECDCNSANWEIRTLSNNVASIDKAFTFEPKAPMLTPTEFETDDEFRARVRKQEEVDMAEAELLGKKKIEIKNQVEENLVKAIRRYYELTNMMNKAVIKREKFKDELWTWESKMAVSDLPYFDRDTLSFMNISCPLVTYVDDDRLVRFDVDAVYRDISFKFGDIKQAQIFKNGIMEGAISVEFRYEFSVEDPKDYVFKESWTETKENGFLKFVRGLGVGMEIVRAAKSGGQCNTALISSAFQENDPRIMDKIEHPAIMGRVFCVNVKECSVVVRGSGAASLGMQLVLPATGTFQRAVNWKLIQKTE